MAFEFDGNAVFQAAALAQSKGCRIVRDYGIMEDGSCTCGNKDHRIGGPAEMQCGKHPRGKAWGERAAVDEDTLWEWVEEARDTGKPFNIGILLGPRSGVVDMEWDDEKAKAYAEAMGLTDVETPTYISGRSEHRLFKWDDRLADCPAVVYPGGLEVRLGTGNLDSQSVLPPSWHWSGVQYRWKDGLSIDDVPFAPLPENLLLAIINDVDPSQRRAAPVSSRTVLHSDIPKGKRHPYLLSYVTAKVFSHARYLSGAAQADMLMEIELVNERHCKPPKSPQELRTLFYSCIEYRRKMETAGAAMPDTDEELEAVAEKIAQDEEEGKRQQAPVSGYAMHGLKWAAVEGWKEGEWLPGDWKIRVICSDPAEIILCVPQWKNTPCKGEIAFSFSEFESAKLVAKKIFESTRRVILHGDIGEWQTIWRGQDGNSKRPKLTGLFEKLFIEKQKADDVHVGTSSLRYATLASYLLEALARAKPASEDKPEPERSGRPRWVTPGELWLGWQKTWEEIGRAHDVAAGERIRIKRLICDRMKVRDFREGRHTFGSTKRSYVVFTPEWIAAVEALAEGAADGFPPNTGETPTENHEKHREERRIPRIETEVVGR
jgi:hypothetical protein